VRIPSKEPSHEKGEKYLVTVHGAPRGRKAYIQWGAAWFPKGIVFDTAVSTPVPCSLQHDTFHLGLGRPEPRWPACVVATPIRVYPPQLLPPPTRPRVEYESTIPRGTDEGLDLWESGHHVTKTHYTSLYFTQPHYTFRRFTSIKISPSYTSLHLIWLNPI
jgi:hypothetical protein